MQVGEERVYPNKMIDLLLEYGPSWKTDLLQDIHMSCSDMFTYPVFCRDGVFWSSKLLLSSISKVRKELKFKVTLHQSVLCLDGFSGIGNK